MNKIKSGAFERIAKRAKEAEERIVLKNALISECQADPHEIATALLEEQGEEAGTQKKALPKAEQAVAELEENLYKGEQLGLFDTHPIKAGNEYPSLLARLPIFLPNQRGSQKKRLDEDNAFPFETPFGKGRRHGANLTVSDEDKLIALFRLRQKRLCGQPGNLPIPLPEIYSRASKDKNGRVGVHNLVCTITQINDELGLSDGGINHRNTLASLKRLTAVSLELEVSKHDRYFGKFEQGGSFRLVDIQWVSFDEYGVIVAQFTPLVVTWLENELTYLNWSIRKKLKGDGAKAIHRFLSSQGEYYENELLRVAASVGLADKSNKKIRQIFEDALSQLLDLEWLEKHNISGTGRKKPFMLEITRKKRGK